jgi:two-component system, chemotaxis family, CheB/CheR fusion protein
MADGAGPCILVVDDHDDTLAMVQRLLSLAGYVVHVARSAEEAIRLAGAHRCDLLVSDVGMPGESGLDLMRQLKAQYGMPGIAVSGFAREQDAADALAAGFDRHLAKPIDFPVLLTAVKALAG